MMLQLDTVISHITGPNFRFRYESVHGRMMVFAVAISCLKWGGFHLVITEVVPVGGGVDKKAEFISLKMTSG